MPKSTRSIVEHCFHSLDGDRHPSSGRAWLGTCFIRFVSLWPIIHASHFVCRQETAQPRRTAASTQAGTKHHEALADRHEISQAKHHDPTRTEPRQATQSTTSAMTHTKRIPKKCHPLQEPAANCCYDMHILIPRLGACCEGHIMAWRAGEKDERR